MGLQTLPPPKPFTLLFLMLFPLLGRLFPQLVLRLPSTHPEPKLKCTFPQKPSMSPKTYLRHEPTVLETLISGSSSL
jgi:hypothetical protein